MEGTNEREVFELEGKLVVRTTALDDRKSGSAVIVMQDAGDAR